MKILVDMNLSPVWVEVLVQGGFDAIHWSEVGESNAPDTLIMHWARTNGYVVFTHDLDFGAALALTQVRGPSVIQVRAQDLTPANLASSVVGTLRNNELALSDGALIVLDEAKARVRVLPLSRA
jgi:predicted nuclease of predicted toxin-antitoxin system